MTLDEAKVIFQSRMFEPSNASLLRSLDQLKTKKKEALLEELGFALINDEMDIFSYVFFRIWCSRPEASDLAGSVYSLNNTPAQLLDSLGTIAGTTFNNKSDVVKFLKRKALSQPGVLAALTSLVSKK